MRQLTDQGILMLYSLTALLFVKADMVFVAAFLITLIYIAVMGLDYLDRGRALFSSCFCVCAILLKPCLLFMPVGIYSMLRCRIRAAAVLSVAATVWSYQEDPRIIAWIAMGILLSACLCQRTSGYEKMLELYKTTRDSGTESALALKEKNKAILENQNYQIYAATLKERNRIAREIHDHVGHMLSRAILMVGAMKTINRDDALSQSLEALEETLHTAMTNVRESVHDLHDDSVDLRAVLEELVSSHTSCEVHLEYDMGEDVPGTVKYSFIAIVKEALSNVAKHSDASTVRVALREHPALYQLVVEDNGSGKGSGDISGREPVTGIGLLNMQERIHALDGTIRISAEKGFRIFISVPKKEKENEDRNHR